MFPTTLTRRFHHSHMVHITCTPSGKAEEMERDVSKYGGSQYK